MHDLSFPRSASASDANRPIRSNLLTGFVRYLRHRRDDLWGRHDRIQTMNAWIVERICPSSRRPVPSNAARAAPHPSWTEVVAGRGLTADSLRRRYEAEATPARAFLVAATPERGREFASSDRPAAGPGSGESGKPPGWRRPRSSHPATADGRGSIH